MERVIELPFDPLDQRKTAAQVLGLIAEPKDAQKRLEFERAACAVLIRQVLNAKPEKAFEPITTSASVMTIPEKKAELIIHRTFGTIKTRRLPAADMAGLLLFHESCQQGQVQPALEIARKDSQGIVIPASSMSVKLGLADYDPKSEQYVMSYPDPTLNALAEQTAQFLNKAPPGWATRRSTGWTRENVIGRIWVPSKPIIHFAISLRTIVQSMETEGRFQPMTFFEADWVERFVAQSKWLRQRIGDSKTLRISPSDMIDIELAPAR